MDLLKGHIDRIQQQLAGLSASQKMLTATLVAIMVMTLFWWGRYAADPEMVVLLDMQMADADLARIPDHLRSKGIPARVVGKQIYVPADQHAHALADLGFSRMLPRNTSSAFDAVFAKMNPFDSPDKQRAMWNEAKQARLSQIISNFEGVADATVMIESGLQRGIGVNKLDPRATINISMIPGTKVTSHLVNAAADLVVGAQQGLKSSDVRVIIDAKPYRPTTSDEEYAGAGARLFEQQIAAEQYYAGKIQQSLSFMPGVIVAVHCQVNNKSSQTQTHSIDPKTKLQLEKSAESSTEESNSTEPSQAEPGAVPNTGMAIAEATPPGPSSTSAVETSKTEFVNDWQREDKVVRDPGGEITVLGASIRLPRSYCVTVYQSRHGRDSQPTEAELDAILTQELETARNAVRTITQVPAENISVALYHDVLPDELTRPQPATAGLPLGLSSHAREIAIGGLAVISLFMVMMMVRKSAPAAAVAEPVEPGPPAQLAAGEDLAGEVGEGNPLLDGMELDDEAVRAQQMINQVQNMVKENPDGAAQLVKRWLNRA
jgi:flagellar biosynthesis/type III secretory pathway M-ring protein FliF/YscJ